MSTLADLIGQRVREAVAGALEDSKAELMEIAKAGGHEASGGLLGDVKNITTILDGIAGTVATIVGLAFPPLGIVKAAEDAGGKLGTGFGVGYFLGSAVFEALKPALIPLNHAVADLAQTEVFDPATAAMLEAKGIIDNAKGRSEAAGGNLSGEHYDKLVASVKQRPEIVMLLEMLRRGLIDQTVVGEALQHHGYGPEWHTDILALQRELLSPADLALADLRGNMDANAAIAYAAKLGVDAADFDTLKLNTGEPPGVMELLFAYRRGFIDQPRLERGIRQSRVRNEWIDVIEKLRYSPMSTADAARAVVENYLPEPEGAKIAEQNGLEPSHWQYIHESWGRPLAHGEMLELYHRGLADRGQVDQAFRESNQKDKYRDQSFELGRRLLPERMIVQAIAHGALDMVTGATKLLEHGYTQEDANILLRLGLSEQKSTSKELSRSQVVSLYEQGLITRNDALQHLTGLKYAIGDSDLMLQLADTTRHAKALKAEVQHIRTLYVGAHIDDLDAENQQVAAGITQAQAASNVALWKRERGKATRNLTEAQILKAATSKTIPGLQALAALQAIGYSAYDAEILLVSHGVTKP
jgi:hypothetical protein